ncbi:GNAT family N-acetyltransferase [Streptomyces sp. NPDC059740]|uniref:GNAT family N-acetyltransferase n=1 Tax=Streptomyces sp. NPDC059740 TaxID=3346926 RepID=UPI003664DEC5
MDIPLALDHRRAVEADLPAVVALYDDAAHWMRAHGITQWVPGGKDLAHFRRVAAAGEVWLALAPGDGRVVGAWELWWEDLPAWGPQAPVAGYVHRLMVDREHAPAGAGRAMLARAEQRIAQAGRELSRLDHVTSNPRLAAYYEAAGYRVVGEQAAKRDGGGSPYGVTLREKRLR